MDFKSGVIDIDAETVSPGYTFEDFQRSKFFEGQDGIRVIQLKDTAEISGNNYVVSLFFRDKRLYMLSLFCIDIDLPFSEEAKRKQFHDEILEKHGLNTESFFEWGNIKSVYNPKGNVSSINITYKERN